jgi:hypothetical protein
MTLDSSGIISAKFISEIIVGMTGDHPHISVNTGHKGIARPPTQTEFALSIRQKETASATGTSSVAQLSDLVWAGLPTSQTKIR